MNRLFFIFGFLFFLTLCAQCTRKQRTEESIGMELMEDSELLSIIESKNGSYNIKIRSAEGVILQELVLNTDTIGPLYQRIISLSSVFTGFLGMLQADSLIVGIDDARYVSNKFIHKAVASKSIVEVYKNGILDFEKLMLKQPDLIFYSGGENLGKTKGRAQTILCNNYLENSPLGRAEWIKLFGIVSGKKLEADSIYKQIKQNYNKIKAQKPKSETAPKVLTGSLYGGAWHLPAGQSYTAQLIADAGGDYIFKNQGENGHLSYSLEQVLLGAHDCDIWLNPSHYSTISELFHSENKYEHFKAFKNKTIYNHTLQMNDFGFFGFWEEGPSRPDLILKDLQNIFYHNDSSTSYFNTTNYFYTKLN